MATRNVWTPTVAGLLVVGMIMMDSPSFTCWSSQGGCSVPDRTWSCLCDAAPGSPCVVLLAVLLTKDHSTELIFTKSSWTFCWSYCSSTFSRPLVTLMGEEPASCRSIFEEGGTGPWNRQSFSSRSVRAGSRAIHCFVQLCWEIKMSRDLSCLIWLPFLLEDISLERLTLICILATFHRHKRAGEVWLCHLSTFPSFSEWQWISFRSEYAVFWNGVPHSEHFWEAWQGNMIKRGFCIVWGKEKNPSFQLSTSRTL